MWNDGCKEIVHLNSLSLADDGSSKEKTTSIPELQFTLKKGSKEMATYAYSRYVIKCGAKPDCPCPGTQTKADTCSECQEEWTSDGWYYFDSPNKKTCLQLHEDNKQCQIFKGEKAMAMFRRTNVEDEWNADFRTLRKKLSLQCK